MSFIKIFQLLFCGVRLIFISRRTSILSRWEIMGNRWENIIYLSKINFFKRVHNIMTFSFFSVYNLCGSCLFIFFSSCTLDSFIPMGDGDVVYKDGVMFCREREKEKRNLNKKKNRQKKKDAIALHTHTHYQANGIQSRS